MAMVVFLILYICCRGVPAAGVAPPAPAQRAARAEIPPMASAIVIEESERKYSKARVIPAEA